jgi:hypothetical protein
MYQTVNSIPARAKWKTQYLFFPDAPDDKHLIQYCDPLEAITNLLGNLAHNDYKVYKSCKIFDISDHSRTNVIIVLTSYCLGLVDNLKVFLNKYQSRAGNTLLSRSALKTEEVK